MKDAPRILLVAGESSGDLHGAAFVRALRKRLSAAEVAGVGGEQLRAAGMRILVDTAEVATMGLIETLGMAGRVIGAYRRVTRFLAEERPHLVVLIDYPEFNMRVAARARALGIPVFYFIGPQVWAWRRGRVHKIASRVDRLALVFPFEPELYNRVAPAQPPLAEFVGHPLLDVVRVTRSRDETRARHGLGASDRVVALLPGSRRKELRYLLGPLFGAAAALAEDGWKPVLAQAPNLTPSDLTQASACAEAGVPVVSGDTYNLLAAADAAVVASGTATLETALLATPMVIVYCVSPVTYWLARMLVKVPWVGMPNLILGRGVFPELLQGDANPRMIAAAVRDVARRGAEMREAAEEVRARLGTPGAAERAVTLALELLP